MLLEAGAELPESVKNATPLVNQQVFSPSLSQETRLASAPPTVGRKPPQIKEEESGCTSQVHDDLPLIVAKRVQLVLAAEEKLAIGGGRKSG